MTQLQHQSYLKQIRQINIIKSQCKAPKTQKISIKNIQIVEKFKKRTEQLKQIKRYMSCSNFSRVNQMKRPSSNNKKIPQIQFYQANLRTVQPQYQRQAEKDQKQAEKYQKQIETLQRPLKTQQKSDSLKLNGQNSKLQNLVIEQDAQNPESTSNLKSQLLHQKIEHNQSEMIGRQTNQFEDKQSNHQMSPQENNKQVYDRQTLNLQGDHVIDPQNLQPSDDGIEKTNQEQKQPQFNKKGLMNFKKPSLTQSDGKKISQNLRIHTKNKITGKPTQNEMNMKRRYDNQIKQSKQKLMKNKVKLLESQTTFKLQKKIKQNLELLQKQKVLRQIVYQRMERERGKQKLTQRRRSEERFVHQSRGLKISIAKTSKLLENRQQTRILKDQADQSLLNMAFNLYVKQKQSLKKQQQMAYKMQFLKGTKNGPKFFKSQVSESRLSSNQMLNLSSKANSRLQSPAIQHPYENALTRSKISSRMMLKGGVK